MSKTNASGGNVLSRDQIMAAADRAPVKVPVPEWNGFVLVRRMSAAQRAGYEEAMRALVKDADEDAPATNLDVAGLYLAHCLVDENDVPLFKLGEIGELMAHKSAGAIWHLFEAASEVNALTRADIEELAGN